MENERNETLEKFKEKVLREKVEIAGQDALVVEYLSKPYKEQIFEHLAEEAKGNVQQFDEEEYKIRLKKHLEKLI